MEIYKTVSESKTEVTHILMPGDINGNERLFGGKLMEWIDIVAGVVGRRHAGLDVITAAVDNLQFKAGAYINDTVVLIGRITYVGRTSMEVRVDTYVEGLDGMRKPINRAYLVLVAIDRNGTPQRVPRLTIENHMEEAEYLGAVKRDEYRKLRRQEGF